MAQAGEPERNNPAGSPPASAALAGDGSPQISPAAGAPAVEWTFHKTPDSLHPDGNEQQVIWLMNRARTNPGAEAAWLATSTEHDISGPRSFFQVDTALLQSEFDGYGARPPAAFDARLYAAAKAHSSDLIARDAQDHTGQFEGVASAGFSCSGGSGYAFRGNVFSYAESALNNHTGWNIDWGGPEGGMQVGRGHRQAVMALDGDYTNVGVAVVAEDDPATEVGPYVVTGNYCHAADYPEHYNVFLVGTVWQDDDSDGRYDPGEGLGGVTVSPEGGSFYAVTADSGGYAIPITQPGSYQVTFSGAVSGVRSVTLSDTSVLLDYQQLPELGDNRIHLPLVVNSP